MNYYVKRLAQSAFTFWATITLTFFLVKYMPGGPLDYIMANMIGGTSIGGGGSMSSLNPSQAQQFQELAQRFTNINPSQPVYVQYIDYVTQLLQGDFGQSIWYSEPVWQVLGPAIPWTVFIGVVGIFISFVTRVVLGALLAYKEGSRLDFATTSVLIWGHALPFYIVAILLIYFFAYQYGWFPIGGRMNNSVEPGLNYAFIAGVLNHATLPIIATAWATFGAGAIAMRANSIQVLGDDYMRVAKLRGLQTKRLTLRYVARNAILPMYTSLLVGIGYVFGGAVLTESIFNYRGVGWYMFKAIQARDYPVLMGGFILITGSVVIALFIADMTYGMLDPRIRDSSEEAY